VGCDQAGGRGMMEADGSVYAGFATLGSGSCGNLAGPVGGKGLVVMGCDERRSSNGVCHTHSGTGMG